MTDLSLAAQAVMDAYIQGLATKRRDAIGAAFRAAADQASPKLHIEDIDYQHQSYVDGWKDALDVILAIADELDNTNNTSEGD
jgi:hypothetical protein